MRSDKLKSSVENNTTIVTLPLGSNAERCAGSSPVTRTISSIHKGFDFMNTRFFYSDTV